MSAPRVLVTGAAGFIGQHLVRALHSRGHPVSAVDLRPDPGFEDGILYRRADFRDAARDAAFLDGVDTVFHLASMHLEVHTGAATFEAVNVQGVRALVESCAVAGVRRLVHTSSVAIYGHVEDPPAREDAPRRPLGPYDRSKLAGEEMARRAAAATGLDLVVLRPAWVYGPGCPRTAKLLRALRRRRFLYVGRAGNLRHPLFVSDMVRGYLAAAGARGLQAGSAYILAGPRAVTLRELVGTFARALEAPAPRLSMPLPVGRALGLTAEVAFGLVGREPPFSRRSLLFFQNDNAFDIAAARRDLGFEPEVDLLDGANRTVAEPWWESAA